MGQDLLKGLNDEQKKGVMTTEGPVLILAGAGSGKTRVLTHRTAHLLDLGVAPFRIMAITFTNKAAKEMRERIDSLVENGADTIWVSTFHSACVRILRRFIDRIGYSSHFTIYDSDDSKTLMKDVLKYLEIDSKQYKEKTFLSRISHAKDELIGPDDYMAYYSKDKMGELTARVYREYQRRLKESDALDFDDLIRLTVYLFRNDKETLEYYQNRIQYLMVDEYQDTNSAQFELIRLLSGKYRNLCVVGDDDQSIYKFRGANIYNILNFEKRFPDATVIKLEENYRSTQNILNAANAVIRNNKGRKSKTLWTGSGTGDKITFRLFESAYEEAEYIALDISSRVYKKEAKYGDFAVLYRTNAQSRLLEEKMVRENIPYKIVGGVNFYQRKEIKDIIAYLKTIDNANDDIAVKRIINIPKRGIGQTTISRVQGFAGKNNMSFYSALSGDLSSFGRSASKLREFTDFISDLRSFAASSDVASLIKYVTEETGYVDALRAENTDESRSRIENIDELISKAVSYQETAEEPSLSGFLEEVALIADIDNLSEDNDYVVLMTLHSAKGLEFPFVYMAGMEEGLFPSFMSINADNPEEEIEEERRLCYVGITRAKTKLTMTAARTRMVRGDFESHNVSRFIKEIPPELLNSNTSASGKKKVIDKAPHLRCGSSERPVTRKKTAALSYMTSYNSKPSAPAAGLGYTVGDRVHHVKFGDGIVKAIADGGRDFEVTVDFDGTVRKMFAGFAHLKKI